MRCRSRARYGAGTWSAIVLVILALALIVSVAPLLRWRATLTSGGDQLSVLGIVLALLLGARALLWLAPVRTWTPQVFHTEALGSRRSAPCCAPLWISCSRSLLFAALVLLGFDFAERHPPARPSQARRTRRHAGLEVVCREPTGAPARS